MSDRGGTRTRTPVARKKRKPADPYRAWAKRLARYRPGLLDFTLDALASMYGRPEWQPRNDATSELVLTILSQNSADINAERAFEALRAAYPSEPATGTSAPVAAPPGWGGKGLHEGAPPDWAQVEAAPLEQLIDVIRPGGLAPQKAPRIQASLRAIRESTGGYDLSFLAHRSPEEADAFLRAVGGIGPKTAAVVLLFSFGMPLMPVDRHVERVSKRVGLVPPKATAVQAHDHYRALLEPGRSYEAHVNLITHGRQTCHARKPECGRCAVAPRCRYPNPRAP